MHGNRWPVRVLTVVLAVLVGVGLIEPGPGLLAAMIALPMFAAMIAFVALTARWANPTRLQTRRATRVAARAAGLTVIGVGAVGGLTDLAGAATGPLLVASAIIAVPWAWRAVRHHVEHLVARLVTSRRTPADPDPSRHRGPAT